MSVVQKCKACRDSAPLPFSFSMAFQPIINLKEGEIWGYEALVRGTEGQGAGAILSQVSDDQIYKFDQAARVKAIELAGKLFPQGHATRLSINFMPNAVYEPAACIRASLQAASRVGLPSERIMFEFTENERFASIDHIKGIIKEYKKQGFLTAMDDVGSGYSGLNILAELQPDLIKLDMELIRNIDTDRVRQIIVSHMIAMAKDLGMLVIVEGVENDAEAATLLGMGANLFQGYAFARPAFEALPSVTFPVM